jgi:biopolymer transport protein ExbB/TolQ
MLRFFQEGGVFMWPILFIAIANLVLVIRVAMRITRGRPEDAPGTVHAINAILFWSALGALLGFLGQHSGLYKAMSVIARAPEISPRMVARGFAESLTTTIFGLAVLALSALAWFVLHAWLRRSAVGARAGA